MSMFTNLYQYKSEWASKKVVVGDVGFEDLGFFKNIAGLAGLGWTVSWNHS